MKILLALIVTLMTYTSVAAQDADTLTLFRYRVSLRDKANSKFSLAKPEQYLSRKAIERRKRQGISIDSTDLPVNEAYVKGVKKCGVKVLNRSKWNNTLLVSANDSTTIDAVRKLDYVTGVRLVGTRYATTPMRENRTVWTDTEKEVPESEYGKGLSQIKQLNGIEVHKRGYRGKGMTIAVIDGGFQNVDIIPAFKNLKIAGTHDFVSPENRIYHAHKHGMQVLSCMATNIKNVFIGTAPEATFWLLRSEETVGEQMAEEDNWAAAVEFADSVGVDVINSSLGYTAFDDTTTGVMYHELNGRTHLVSRSASMLASKGIVLCNSAGNEGNDTWKKIGVPADASDILAVGAVEYNGKNANFSSLGNTADGRIKPDVCAMGRMACVMDIKGHTTRANGTSFASPILAGMVACLWQALPDLTAYEIIDLVRGSGNNTAHPDNVFGFGIPDFTKALDAGKKIEAERGK